MKITIEDYNEQWPLAFAQQRDIIRQALSGIPAAIEHIGSTSVPGLGAKPIIDILVGLDTEAALDSVIFPMQQSGYTYHKKYEPLWRERRYFVKLQPITGLPIPTLIDIGADDSYRAHFNTTVHIHIVEKDKYDWQRHIAFRDYLRAHPDVRAAYEQIKRKISEQEFTDMIAYNDMKDAFVKTTEKAALAWYTSRPAS